MSDVKKRVTAIQGIPVSSVPPITGQVLQFNGTEYVPTTLPTLFSPTSISGLQLWLRSDMGITLSGNQVTGWADQSGTGDSNKNMVGAGGSANPTFNASDNMYAGFPSVSFRDSLSQYMKSTGTWASPVAQPYTIFVVANDDGTVGGGAEIFVGGDTVTNPWLYNNDGVYSILAGGTNLTTSISATGYPEVFRGEYDGASSAIGISKTTPNLTGTVGAGSVGAGTDGVWLGADNQYMSGHFLNGKIVEVLIYNSILAYSNMILVQSYLSARYDIAISP
jgi:hypothetical protein